MTANNQKNTRILLFLLLCLRMTLTVDANDFLFTSINTAQGLSDNQIKAIVVSSMNEQASQYSTSRSDINRLWLNSVL